MTPQTAHDRLFVPLKSSAFRGFLAGSKTWELRRHGRQWARKHLVVGRRVELRCGYRVGRSLWGRIITVEEAASIDQMFARVGYMPFVPRATSSAEALEIAVETLGAPDEPVIAFQVALDP